MRSSGLHRWWVCAALPIAAGLGCGSAPVRAGDAVHSGSSTVSALSTLAGGSVETIHFAKGRQSSVRLVRGTGGPRGRAYRSEVVSFGPGRTRQVTIVRGGGAARVPPGQQASLGPATRVERVSFPGAQQSTVTVVRGSGWTASPSAFSLDLFGAASGGELDRVAFAVDGAESRHGADPGMWRAEPDGPQGPMQVSAAAALDVGGGDRFDLQQNRRLGRAYLGQMFRRFGNWADALAAYNWGPTNVDQWIAGGRDPDRLPPETAGYIDRVLRDALINSAARL